jgi:AraC-like DNA-binding protein
MFDQDYSALRLVRLSSCDEWSAQKEGLSFIFPKEGIGQYVNGSVAQRLMPGDILVCVGGAAGKLRVPQDAELIFWSFSLRLEHLFPLFADEEICLLQRISDTFMRSKWLASSTPLAKKCHRLIEEIPLQQFDLEHRGHLLRVAAAILNEAFKTVCSQRGGLGLEDRIIRVFEGLSPDQVLGWSVEELANKFGCSRRHLNRLFHQYFGFSVGALKMEMRLLKAVTLLRDANTKVINVAEQCGYNHLGLFNTCFKRRFGMSPGRWRKQSALGKIRSPTASRDDAMCPLQARRTGMLTGTAKTSVPASPVNCPFKNTLGAKDLPCVRTGEQAILDHVRLTYPKASNSMPVRT